MFVQYFQFHVIFSHSFKSNYVIYTITLCKISKTTAVHVKTKGLVTIYATCKSSKMKGISI